jgi:hypothetical protein
VTAERDGQDLCKPGENRAGNKADAGNMEILEFKLILIYSLDRVNLFSGVRVVTFGNLQSSRTEP